MKILIFTNEKTLLEFRAEQSEPTAVLDFTASTRIKNAIPAAIAPVDVFTIEEKERVRAEYIEAISDLADFNGFSLHWLCHPISEKNDLAPDNLFDRLVDFLTFSRILTKQKEETLLILPRRATLARNIADFSAAQGIYCRVEGGEPWKKGFFKRLKSWGKKQVSRVQGTINTQRWYLKSRHFLKKLDKTKTYTIIRTWFDSRSPALLENCEDIYFGKFPRFLQERSHQVLFFGDYAYGFEHTCTDLKKEYKIPLVLTRSMLHGLDFLKAARFTASVIRKLRIKTGIKILGVDVDAIFNGFFHDYAGHPQVHANYMSYLAVGKLLEQIAVDVFYLPFENYAWEKLSWRAVARYSPRTRLVAFQHAQVALNATKFYLGEKENRSTLFPDRIVTLGEVTREVLSRRCNYPASKMVTGCALRQDYVIDNKPIERTGGKLVLAQLWSVPKSVRMINFLHASRIHPDRYSVTLNPHPNNPLEVLIPQLNFTYKNHFPVAEGPLSEDFKRHGVVVYHGTTACLDALASGLPVIEVEFDDFISVDPLFAFHDFKWTVKEPGKLAETIDAIFSLSDEEYYRRQQKGFEFVRKYFYPVNKENLEMFLI